MKNLLDTNRLYPVLGWTLLGLLMVLLALEGWRYGVKPSETNHKQMVENSLNEAADYFVNQQKKLLANSKTLVAHLRHSLLQNRSSDQLQDILNRYPDFWSAVLLQNGEPVIWDGFALQNIDNRNRDIKSDSHVALKRHNNVIYWESHVPFTVQDSLETTSYDLFTSYRIEQRNPLDIGDQSEFNIFDSSIFSTAYPLNFSIFSEPPSDVTESEPLINLQGDSVGVVYATADKFEQTQAKWNQNTRFWRSIYALLCFTVLISIVFGAAKQFSLWISLATRLLIIGISWAILAYTDIISYWFIALSGATESEWVSTVESLSATGTNAVFGLFASIVIGRALNKYHKKVKPDWYLSTISTASALGVVNAVTLLSFFILIYEAAVNSGVSTLDLRLFPDGHTVILYLVMGLSTLAAGIFLIALNRTLFRINREHVKLTASVVTTTFFISLFIAQIVIPERLIFNWIFYSCLLGFVIIVAISITYANHRSTVAETSPLRKVIISSVLIAIICTPVIYQTSLVNIDENLWQTAQNYSQEEDPVAAELTEDLLSNLEANFRSISREDLEDNRSTLQTRFTNIIQRLLSRESNAYSFDLHLISASGEPIADYATDLNSPNWVNIFNISTLKVVTEIEQITKSTIRPIVQLPQLINQQEYSIFYRGWIPIFGTSEDGPIAWILCSVYQERPEYNKPIRTVLASLTYEDWNTAYLMQKFNNGKLINATQQGFAGYFPTPRTLGNNKLKALEQDSLIYLTEESQNSTYRTLLWKESNEIVIKISTTLPDYRITLFSFFRLSFILLLAGCLALLLRLIFSWNSFRLLGKNKRFQDRILDSFLLATLIFLALLIATSHYAIKQQNREIVRQELVDKLERLSIRIEANPDIRNNQDLGPSFSLDPLTTPLDVDASFYAGRTVTETTTPQIYQQHLLPAALPYEIYHKLFNRRQQDAYSTVKLASQNLLIGYRSILNDQNQPVATIAIPTFLESPKYDQQLLETTSYLILVYILVFGLFIVGSTFISRQLTRPLVYIQRGLNKISGGNLDTTIPVTSDDEIGNLAEAYNNMVFRLKKLRKELATAEREAAWKEMAQQVAHEIKNPLTPMKLNVQHLERQLKSNNQDPKELKKRVQKITDNLIDQIQSLNNIASDFSKFSQPLDEEFTKVNLASILKSVAELYKHDETVDIKFEADRNPAHVRGIPDELKRVIINLVKNAYEAMSDNGGEIVLRLYHQQKHVFIEVEDNGRGIAEEDRPNIFVPNFSTKSSGTGLGLAICKKIIEAHEGSITFASVEDEGTTFVIKLPQA